MKKYIHVLFVLVALCQFPQAMPAGIPSDLPSKSQRKNIRSVLLSFAQSIGCSEYFDEKNLIRIPKSYGMAYGGYMAIIAVDVGCSGGSGSSNTFPVVLTPDTSGNFYVDTFYTKPDVPLGLPKLVSGLEIRHGEIFFHGKAFDPEHDALCCPSMVVVGKLLLTDGQAPARQVELPAKYWHIESVSGSKN